MSVHKEFSKHAKEYSTYNIIQQLVAKALVRDILNKPKNILELGCGSGQIYKNISWTINNYTALDFSQEMCSLHPIDSKVKLHCINFDTNDFLNFLQNKSFDQVISSSALQWSKDLSIITKAISKVTKHFNGALFTSNTFKTIQELTNKKSPILDESTIKDAFLKYFDCEFETFTYNLEFDNKKDIFDYIKKSGVSGESSLTYKESKNLYKEYNLNYLEFEVIFVKATVL